MSFLRFYLHSALALEHSWSLVEQHLEHGTLTPASPVITVITLSSMLRGDSDPIQSNGAGKRRRLLGLLPLLAVRLVAQDL